jgi:hypothetical protein
MLLIKKVDDDQFKHIVDLNYQIYPGFKILWEKNYSDRSLEETIELMNLEIGTIIEDKKKKMTSEKE